MPTRAPPKPRGWVSWGLLTLLALGVAVQTVRTVLAHRFALADPATALAWSAGDGEAGAMRASRAVAASLAARLPAARQIELADAARTARAVLAREPLRVEALRDLGLVADASGNAVRARGVMASAAGFGWRDVATQAWLLKQTLSGDDLPASVTRIDAILRTEPDLSTRLFPLIAALAGDPRGRGLVARALAAAPPWRDDALGWLPTSGADPAVLIALDGDLARLGHPADTRAIGAALTRLVDQGRLDQAHELWLNTLPPPSRAAASGTLFDGGFRGLDAPPPFGWRFTEPTGGRVAMEASSGERALVVAYPASATTELAEQLLRLAPGSYRLSGRARTNGAASGAALRWTVSCVGPPRAPLLEQRHPAQGAHDWAPFAAAFTVPAGCPAQWLRLVGLAGDGFGDVSAAYARLIVERAAP